MVGGRRENDVLFGFESIKLIHQLCHRSWAQDDVAACATWLYKGFPLSPAASLPPKLELKEDRHLRQEWISRELMRLVQSWYHSHHQLNIVFIYMLVCVQIEFSYCLGSCFKTYKLQSRFKQLGYEMKNYCHALHVSWQPAVFKSQRVLNSPLCFVRFCRVQVLPWRNWKHWDVDDAHLKRLDPWLHVKMLPQSY